MKVISLGWGCQSFALAAMSALGVLPKVDAAIHADTTHERAETYAFARKWTPWLEERGVQVVTVRDEKAASKILELGSKQIFIPAFTVNENASGPEKYGRLLRVCTQRWKIAPIRRWLQANRKGEHVEMWLGITLDEVERMTKSKVGYISNIYPFIDMPYPWARSTAVQWLKDNGLEVPVKSACTFCPFHSRAAWREIKLADAGNWQKAVTIDQTIRNMRPDQSCYLVAERKPLEDCDFSSQEDNGQLRLFGDEECSGMCFL